MAEKINDKINDNVKSVEDTEASNNIFDENEYKKQNKETQKEIQKSKKERLKKAKQLTKQYFREENEENRVKHKITISEKPSEQLETSTQKDTKTKKEYKQYIKHMVKKKDIEWILNHLWFDKDAINNKQEIKLNDFINDDLIYDIESLKPKKIISNTDKFLENENEIINETQKEYDKLYERLTNIVEWNDKSLGNKFLKDTKKLFKRLKAIKRNWLLGKFYRSFLMRKKVIKRIINLKNAIKAKEHDIWKYKKRAQEYENWEYINFPNWINFELWKWPELIPWTNITIWQNEFYIKTHIEKNSEQRKTRYIEYVDSLKKAIKLFEKKWIKIRYCKRHTRLANREFIEEYEKKRQKRKWRKYEKSTRLKILEQTGKAVISYKLEKNGKSPIRFIDKKQNKNLFKFAQKSNNFCEAEMWLDLTLL